MGLQNVTNLGDFIALFISILNKHAPLKTRFLRANSKPHMSKELRKAIMLRSQLKNKANHSRDPEDMAKYRAQRNLVVKMNRNARKLYFHQTDSIDKNFWTACKPFLSDKAAVGNRTVLVEDDKIISDEKAVATVFNKYFVNITESLEIQQWNPGFLLLPLDPVEKIYQKYSSHPSILSIKEKYKGNVSFDFSPVTPSDIYEVVMSLDSAKKISGDIPTFILKSSVACISKSLSTCFNSGLNSGVFPDELKLADVVPVHKKDSANCKSNYRPISLLPSISKVFEKLICLQLTSFMADKLSSYLWGFRKGYSTKYAIFQLVCALQKGL